MEGVAFGGLEEVKGGKSIKGIWIGFDLARRWKGKTMSGRENGIWGILEGAHVSFFRVGVDNGDYRER